MRFSKRHTKHSQRGTGLCETAFLGTESSLNVDGDGDTLKNSSTSRETFLRGRTNGMFFTYSVFAWWYYNSVFFIEWRLDLNFPTIIRENSSKEKDRPHKFSRVRLSSGKMLQRIKALWQRAFTLCTIYSCGLLLNSQDKGILDSSIRLLEAVNVSLLVALQKTLRDNLVNMNKS